MDTASIPAHTMTELGEAVAELRGRHPDGDPITVIATRRLREAFDPMCLRQALHSRAAPGVSELVLNPDAHAGYGAPIGCVLVSPTHIYPGPVGVDIKCSMSLLQLDVPADAIAGREVRRALIDAICERTPTGPGRGQRSARKARRIAVDDARRALIEGASARACESMGIPPAWAARCEDAAHPGHDGATAPLERRAALIAAELGPQRFADKLGQLGSYGGGNHFGECEVVTIDETERARRTAATFGMRDGHVAFLSHCGSRGLGNMLAVRQFKALEKLFEERGVKLPGGDRELVYAELGTPEADAYLDDMAVGANFATLNHLLINALVLEAFQEVLPGTTGDLVYFISHNIARPERVGGRDCWVHRKGATRAFPAGHEALRGTPYAATGHPILLPGNPTSGSVVMAADAGAALSCFSVNHGAGRAMGRRAAIKTLDQAAIDDELAAHDIMTNSRHYPRDEAPAAYKDFEEVLRAVRLAGLASPIARLRARFVIKDADSSVPPD